MGLSQATAEPAHAIFGVEKIDVVADAGYFQDLSCARRAECYDFFKHLAAGRFGEVRRKA
jgi:hypothetical protein